MKAQANTPEDICRLFRRYMREVNLDSVLSVYDSDIVLATGLFAAGRVWAVC